ncbi:MAG: hypothetical protein IPH07_39160 [Deltaproteobacteria bacterium]|nr:hypothetical protein [Deltaproteobacteria bacterium]
MRFSSTSPIRVGCALLLSWGCAPTDDVRSEGAEGSTTAGEAGTTWTVPTTSSTGTAGDTSSGSSNGSTGGTTGGPDDSGDSSGETGEETPMLPFPRLGGMLIGNPKSYDDPEYQAEIARLDLAVLGMYYGWGPGDATPASAIAEIRALHPEMLLANYTIMTEVHNSTPSSAALREKLDAELGPGGEGDWWARDANGNHTDWANGGYGAWDTNLTLFTTPDANGDHWPQWLAGSDHERLVGNIGLDVWYSDNNMWRPRSNADWDGDGDNDDNDDPAVQDAWRDGQRAYYERAREIAPEMLIMVNADNDLSGEYKPSDADPFEQYKNIVHGAYLEHVMGAPCANEG